MSLPRKALRTSWGYCLSGKCIISAVGTTGLMKPLGALKDRGGAERKEQQTDDGGL